MAGTSIDFEIDDRQVRQTLDRLIQAGVDLTDPMREIGEILLQHTQERFARGNSPAGVPWAPLDAKYRRSKRKRKSRGADAILVLDDELRGGLAYDSGADWVELGSNRIYAATHQFGAPDRGIPRRPFLGFSADDHLAIEEILAKYLAEAAGR